MGILGAVMAINLNTVLVTLMHYRSVSKMLRFSMKSAEFLRTGAAMALMGLTCWAVYGMDFISSGLLRFFLAAAAGFTIYLAAAVLLKLVDKSDFGRLPFFKNKQ
ncbi:Stage V sporulation protein B [compost metagenome]